VWFEPASMLKPHQMSCVEVMLLCNLGLLLFILTLSLQILHEGGMRIADVQFYFYLQFGEAWYPLAMLRLFSMPDEDILANSSSTVYLCDPSDGPAGVVVVLVTSIHSVVSMFPDMEVSPSGQISLTGKFSMMHHAFIELTAFSSDRLFDEDYNNL
jgi:hypothetical protein